MKRVFGMVLIVLFFIMISPAVFGQGFFQKLFKPDIVGGNLVATHLDGLGSSTSAGPGFDLYAGYYLSPKFYLSIGTGVSTIYDQLFSYEIFKTTLFPTFELKANFSPVINGSLSPFLFAGLNGFGFKSGDPTDDKLYFDGSILLGGGLGIKINDQLVFNASGDYRYIFTTDFDPKPKHWVAKAGVSYALDSSRRTNKRDEIEYPLGDGELALEDLFREDNTSTTDKSNYDEEDALALLFQPEASGSVTTSPTEETSYKNVTYPDTEVGQLYARIQNMKDEMDRRVREIEDLQNQVAAHEKVIAEMTGRIAGDYTGYTGDAFGVISRENFKTNYEMALQKFYDKKYNEAIRIFKSLLTTDPDHRLASNCQYWIGESYNALGQYRDAINAFNTVLNYKTSYKFDDALLMNGLVYLKLGDRVTARDNFQQLVSRYPDSEYAPKAMRYLGRL